MLSTQLIQTTSSLILILISWKIYHESLKSPQPRIPSRNRTGPEKRYIPDLLRVLAFFLRSIMHLLMLGEIWALLLSSERNQRIIGFLDSTWFPNHLCPSPQMDQSTFYPGGRLTRLAAIGLIIQALGGLLRIWSQRTLGRFFTWELTIMRADPELKEEEEEISEVEAFLDDETFYLDQKSIELGSTTAGVEHKLITSGPYTFIRHPGYSGALFLGTGQLLFGLSSFTFLNECVRFSRFTSLVIFWKVIEMSWLAVFAFSICLIVSRVMKEDEMLRREFGREWEVWAGDVKWKLIPFVY